MAKKITKPITPKQYLKSGGSVCPACKSKNITGGSFKVDGTSVWNRITCKDCGANWLDIYTLTNYEYLIR